jgi:pseudouridine synthase
VSKERLQKILARIGVGSRRHVEELIREGRVTINGQAAVLGDRVDLEEVAVKVDGRRIQHTVVPLRYLLLNKPAGVVSTVSDPEGRKTVLDLVPQRLRHGMVPVGRLDYETEGLLLLTNDGDLVHRVAHPRFGHTKTYEAKVKGSPSESAIERLRRGVILDGRRTAAAEITPLSETLGQRIAKKSTWWTVVLVEGRPRQVREMFFRIGHSVRRLRRVAIGNLRDSKLPVGACRGLTEEEVEALRNPQPIKKKATRGAKAAAAKKSGGKGLTAKGRPKNSRATSGRAKGPESKTRMSKTRTAKTRDGEGPQTRSKGPSTTAGPSQEPTKARGPRRERSRPGAVTGGRPRKGSSGRRGGGRGRG